MLGTPMATNVMYTLLFTFVAVNLVLGGADEVISWKDFVVEEGDAVIRVAKDGTGDVDTVQAAFDRVPDHNNKRIKILLLPGTYNEKVNLENTKTFVSLIGTDRSTTTISWNKTAGPSQDTQGSATVSIRAMFFCACNVTFENSAPSPQPGENFKQGVALLLAAERTVIYRCNIIGFQDTLFDQHGVHFVLQSYIRGTVDFICGSGQTLYKECILESVAERFGAFTASERETPDGSGFVFAACELRGSGHLYLGRTWGAMARVVYSSCFFSDVVIPEGWGTMTRPGFTSDVFLGEFNCTGPGSNLSQRVPWMRKLTHQEVEPFLNYKFIQGDAWLNLS